MGRYERAGQGVCGCKGCLRGGILCGSRHITCLIAVVAAEYFVVTAAALASLPKYPAENASIIVRRH